MCPFQGFFGASLVKLLPYVHCAMRNACGEPWASEASCKLPELVFREASGGECRIQRRGVKFSYRCLGEHQERCNGAGAATGDNVQRGADSCLAQDLNQGRQRQEPKGNHCTEEGTRTLNHNQQKPSVHVLLLTRVFDKCYF